MRKASHASLANDQARVSAAMQAPIDRTLEREQQVYAAMIALREGRGTFVDALIGAIGSSEGCSRTATFDRKALRLSGFAPE